MTRPNHGGLRRHTAEFIRELADWRLFITLTFDRDVPAGAAHEAVKAFLREIATRYERRHFRVAWGCEWQLGGRPHYHVLAAPIDGGDFVTERLVLERLWTWGDCRVEHVRDGAAVAGYLAKHAHSDAVVVCDRSRPCRRKHGCRHGGPWPAVGEYITE